MPFLESSSGHLDLRFSVGAGILLQDETGSERQTVTVTAAGTAPLVFCRSKCEH